MNAISRSTRGPVTVTHYTAEHAKCSLFVLEVKIISILTYSPTHVLTAIFSGDPGLASTRMSLFWLTGVKDDGGGGDNCSYKMCKAFLRWFGHVERKDDND